MPEFRSPIDAMVGNLSVPGTAAAGAVAPGTADDLQLRVFMSGAGASDPGAIGLDEDVRLLVNAFVRHARSGARHASAARPASHAHGDMEIALHGLNLTVEEANELRHLIRELVDKRAAGDGATP